MERQLLQDLISWKSKKNRKPLILLGARQVGKTHLLKTFGKQEFLKLYYLNFEESQEIKTIFASDLDPDAILSDLAFHFNETLDLENGLFVFDEIQDCPNALKSLKYFCEKCPEIFLCAAGSHIGVHLSPDSFPVGKVDELHLYPMSFMEFLSGTSDQKSVDALKNFNPKKPFSETVHTHLWIKFKQYLVTGGLPEVVDFFSQNQSRLFEAFQLVRQKQQELLSAYLRDVAKHSGKINAMHIERILQNIPKQLAHETISNRFQFKDIVPGIKSYSNLAGAIDWLSASGLILKCNIVDTAQIPLAARTKENRFKLYLFDVGLLGCLAELSPKAILDFDFGDFKGTLVENFVAQHLRQLDQKKLYCWNSNTAEVDFLWQQDQNIIPLEVKAGSTSRGKSLSVYFDRYEPPFGILFHRDNAVWKSGKKLLRCPIYLTCRLTAIVESLTHSTR